MNDATTHQVLCNACKVAPEPVPDSNPEAWRCPSCGVSDSRENIIGEVKKHAIEVASRRLQDTARKAAGRSRFIKFEGKPIPKGVYRFVTDIEARA